MLSPAAAAALQDSIPHPMDDQKPDVPGSCILLAATVDGVLRLYRLANFLQDAGLAKAPEQMPVGLPPQLLMALAAAQQALAEEVSSSSSGGGSSSSIWKGTLSVFVWLHACVLVWLHIIGGLLNICPRIESHTP
jgi:hypothetical protein